jgi:hypothetical protein
MRARVITSRSDLTLMFAQFIFKVTYKSKIFEKLIRMFINLIDIFLIFYMFLIFFNIYFQIFFNFQFTFPIFRFFLDLCFYKKTNH